VLCAAALAVGLFSVRERLYGGVDSRLALALIRDAGAWTTPWTQAQISHLQGMGTQQLPGNVWVNPGYAILLLGAKLPQVLGSYLFFAGSLFLAVTLLGRVLGAGAGTTLVAAQLAALLPFPHLEEFTGLHGQLRLNPGVVFSVAIAVGCLCLLLRIGTGTRAQNAAWCLALPALALYGLHCDPLWTVLSLLSLGVFFLAALATGRTGGADAWRAGAILGGLGLALLLRVPPYLLGLFRYTARARFRTEIVGEIQDRTYAFLPFHNARTAVLFALLLAGTILAVRHESRAVRRFAWAALAHQGLLTAATGVYLYTDFNWTFPLPAYFQQAALPVYLLVAAAGWAGGISRAVPRLPGWQRLAGAVPRRWATAGAVPLAGLLLAIPRALDAPANRPPLAVDYVQAGRVEHPYFLALERELALAPGRAFAGSTVLYLPGFAERNVNLAQGGLWIMGVPSLEEYSQLVSPPLYYLATRALGRPEDGPSGRNRIRVSVPRPALLRALGVRYVLTSAAVDAPLREAPGCILRRSDDANGLRLYEIPDPNVGNCSPVRVMTARTAREIVEVLVSPTVDLARDVVLTEPVGATLVPAREASLVFERQGVRVRARSDGVSLLLLPLQYSHALRVRDAGGTGRLVRANLAQAGLVFSGAVDALVTLEVGIGSAAGRALDLADLDALGIGEDGTRRVPRYTRMQLHPYARWSFSGR
jgi:hypothetical protein